MIQIVESLPKKICSKCGLGQFHTWDEHYSDLMRNSKTHNIWIQCNICSHRSILSTTTMTTSCKSNEYTQIRMPEPKEFETF